MKTAIRIFTYLQLDVAMLIDRYDLLIIRKLKWFEAVKRSLYTCSGINVFFCPPERVKQLYKNLISFWNAFIVYENLYLFD